MDLLSNLIAVWRSDRYHAIFLNQSK